MQSQAAEILRGCWYVAATGAKIRPHGMIVTKLAGEPIVVARDGGGKVFALHDSCPHRGVPLHYGRVVDGTIECPYHGWRFNLGGVCVEIPSCAEGQQMNISKIRCQQFHAVERYGLVWVYLSRSGEAPTEGTAPEPPELPGVAFDAAPQFCVTMDFPASIDHSVLSLMDLTHAPFVHKMWWFKKGATKLRPKEKVFERGPFEFRMKRHSVPPQNMMYHLVVGSNATTEVHYMLPAYRIESISTDQNWCVALTVHSPIDAETTLVYQCFWSSISWISLFAPIFRYFIRVFLGQDRHYVVLQREGLASGPNLMLINDADTQARWWMRLKAEWKNAAADSREFRNPVREQTLRWRS